MKSKRKKQERSTSITPELLQGCLDNTLDCIRFGDLPRAQIWVRVLDRYNERYEKQQERA